ncbi:MAG: hypothetical protein GY707_05605 [Desulfobacteraceae bacterium]|nr:hypothetical protein [Desulfobacteraceae bacterium]
MNQKKVKKIRKVAKRMCKSLETVHILGKDKLVYNGESITLKDGTILYDGKRLEAGVPTVMDTGCLKFITKKLKKGYGKQY